ncbi:MAG: hypothetical protein KGN00_01435, partial [Chloroflexota bacterium]|nr:hypothetical protein [Chloroflexota bacterium]
MTATATLPTLHQPLDPDVVERFSVERGEPEWLRRSRRAAAERVNELPWPTGHEEEWRRFPPASVPASPLVGARSTVARGRDALPEGVYVADLDVAVRERPDLVERWIDGGGKVPTHGAISAVADALWTAGTFVHVSRGVAARVPITSERTWAAGDAACLSRTIVVAEEESSITFV